MPYRRLPNTDAARVRALKTAIEKTETTDYNDLCLSTKTVNKARKVLVKFESLIANYHQVYQTQVESNKVFLTKVKNARMYISHFIQVLYMSIIRSEIKENQLELYGLEDMNMLVPDLTSNDQIMEWGRKIIDGETKRTSRGAVPIYNPTIAKVNVMYSLFKEGYETQKLYQENTTRQMKMVSEYREVVDDVIFNIWEEVEKSNEDLPQKVRLDKNREYGIVYYYRKGELVE
ncbi:MAG: hypothetical protein ACOYEA_05995 [Fermentimonas sp.]|jgi:hypothetical protein